MKKFSLLFLLFSIFVFSVSAQRADKEKLGVSVSVGTTAVYSGTQRPRIVSDAYTESAPNSLFAAERKTFDLINQAREKRGLRPLKWSDDAARVARLHSRNMAQYHFFSHRGLDGSMVDDRAERLGIFNWRAIGENIAFNRGYGRPVELAVQKWLESSSHRSNLLNKRWVESGVGIAVSRDGSYYFTQVFMLRK